MYRPRIIPVLLIDGVQAVKTKQFGKPVNLGDPVNMVSIFNAFQVDELVVLDIGATRNGRGPDLGLMRDIASEAQMPFSAGGGITDCKQIGALLSLGAEKVVISTAALCNPGLIREAVGAFGSSSITVCLDVGQDWRGRHVVRVNAGRRVVKGGPLALAIWLQQQGAGEIIVQSIARDGMRNGYDLVLLKQLAEATTVPLVALGGAGSLEHMQQTYQATEVNALAAGSFFCFKGRGDGVLVSYPDVAALHTFRQFRTDTG